MIANYSIIGMPTGTLGKDVHLEASSRYALLDFIADELPRWRDRPDREATLAETVLTSQLCGHLNGAARHSNGWDILQFRVEERDEQNKNRKIDLIPAPSGVTIWIEGRSYTDFDALLPIECKRLPVPNDNKRDEREYVFSQKQTTGGIQRFKAGHHGAAHSLAAMIGYVQEQTATFWLERMTGWIQQLEKAGEHGWSQADLLQLERSDASLRMSFLRSSHSRANCEQGIDLRHLWVQMY